MSTHTQVSRRHMLAMSAAGLAMSRVGAASAQAVKRIEQFDPALDRLISTTEPIKELATGLGGPLGSAEGPVWIKEGGYLLFSDINAGKRMKYTPGQGVSVFQDKTNQANGLTRDLQGRLVACEHETRRVTRQEQDGSITVIANSFQGRPLNRPNDSSSSPTAASISPTRTAASSPNNGTSPSPACSASAEISAP